MAGRDQLIGLGTLIGSIAGILIYFYLLFLTEFWQIILKLTAFAAVAGLLGILAWIGYTLATTPPPKPVEEIEKELEEELRKTEEQMEKTREEGKN